MATTTLERSLQAAAAILRASQHAVALVGAGLSAESGIPTYRGSGGVWTKFGEPTIDGWDLFTSDPEAWWRHALDASATLSEFSRAVDGARPNAGHLAMAELERLGKLRHIITQNIDNLHQRAGSRGLTEIHGNRFLGRCMTCGQREPLGRLSMDRLPPLCRDCGGIMKNDTVMFGEPIPEDALRTCYLEASLADSFLVVGTSAVVYPAADLPVIAKRRGAPLIEINPEATALTDLADVVVRATAGESLPLLVHLLRET